MLTETPNLVLRRATLADFDQVYAILEEASKWLLSRKLPQWEWFLTEDGKAFIRRRIEIYETYLTNDAAGRPAGTFTLQWEDEYVWGERGKDGLAGYVHGLATARAAAGKGLGKALLDAAEKMIAARGRKFFRLDCIAHNQTLCDYYRAYGFKDLGVKQIQQIQFSPRLFQLEIPAEK